MDLLNRNFYKELHEDWALLTAGSMAHYNTMTIGWGGVGCLWGKPTATVYVRPNRYTYEFMEDSDFFTVSFYPATQHEALKLLGRTSGRDGDKVQAAGLHPSAMGDGVTFREARLTLLCRKLYHQDLDAAAMDAQCRERYYGPENPVHRMYIGEILEIRSEEDAK